jgi:ADP-heptose:LPS heptosyltransferase
MRVVKFKHPLVLEGNNPLAAGESYVMSDHMFRQIKSKYAYVIESHYDLGDLYKPVDGSDMTGKNLLVWRTGGIGDLLFMSPCIKKLKEMYPGLKVRLACASKYSPLWDEHDLLDDGRSYPIPFSLSLIEWADYHLHFEGIIESGGRAEYIHAVDLFMEYFKLEGKMKDHEKRPILPNVNDVNKRVRRMFRDLNIDTDKFTVLWQFKSSSPIRTFPERRVVELSDRIAADFDWNVLLIDHPSYAPVIDKYLAESRSHQNVYNITSLVKSIRETISIMGYVDMLIAPDSSLTHLAGSPRLDLPTLALYGPFLSAVRTKYYPKCIAIDAVWGPNGTHCTPCYKHGHKPCDHANDRGESPCFSAIKNKTIIDLLEKMSKVIKKDDV